MTKIGASDARAGLSSLLERVANGEEFVITRFGTPAARLAPLPDVSRERRRWAIERLMEFSRGQTLGDLTIRELREQGRRS
jgi:prevent-host-death family protein